MSKIVNINYGIATIASLLFIYSSCSSTVISNQDSIKVEILNSILEISKDSLDLNITVKIKNNTDVSLLFYNFMEVEAALLSEVKYSNGNCTSGNAIFILDESNTNLDVFTSIPNEIEWSPITEDTLSNLLVKLSNSFRENIISVKRFSEIDLKVNLDLNGYELIEGEYTLFLMYYSGNNLENIVNIQNQKLDNEKYKTSVFRGIIKSNTVKLIVKQP